MGKIKAYFQSYSTDDFEVINGNLMLDGVQVVGKDEMKEFCDWLAGEVGDADAIEGGAEYDFNDMGFVIKAAKKGDIHSSFTWGRHKFGASWWCDNCNTKEGRAELDRIVREYERIHGKG